MELIKKSERKLHLANTLDKYRTMFDSVKVVSKGRYLKKKDYDHGVMKGKLTVHLDIYYVELDSNKLNFHDKMYMIGDTLGRICFMGDVDFSEIKNWLDEKGYMTEKDFYLNVEGMSAEDYEEWCNA